MSAILALIKLAFLLTYEAGRVVKEITAAIMTKEFFQKCLTKFNPLLETTLMNQILSKSQPQVIEKSTHRVIVIPRTLCFRSLSYILGNVGLPCPGNHLAKVRNIPCLHVRGRKKFLRDGRSIFPVSISPTSTPSTPLIPGKSDNCRCRS